MTVIVDRTYPTALHPVHAILLAGSIPLFLGALLSDAAYASSYQIQWTNFASWLIVGGLIFSGFALLCAVIDRFRTDRGKRSLVYILLLLATWILGFINALHHARDAWATMPTGLVLSVIVFVLACAATWIGFTRLHVGDTQ